MDSNKSLTRAGYLLALLLVVVPLFDAGTSMWPLRLSDERWRFGAIGSLSNITLVPLLGLLLALSFAVFLDHRRTRRFLGWICGLMALGLAIMAVLFILDYFQARTIVRPQAQSVVTIATTVALVKDVFTILILVLLARAGFAGPKVVVRKKQVSVADPVATPLIPMPGAARAE